MIEIKLLSDDIEGVRDLGISLLQNGYIYRLRKQARFVIFEILNACNDWVTCFKTEADMNEKMYHSFRLSIGDNPVVEFKAFALKIY